MRSLLSVLLVFVLGAACVSAYSFVIINKSDGKPFRDVLVPVNDVLTFENYDKVKHTVTLEGCHLTLAPKEEGNCTFNNIGLKSFTLDDGRTGNVKVLDLIKNVAVGQSVYGYLLRELIGVDKAGKVYLHGDQAFSEKNESGYLTPIKRIDASTFLLQEESFPNYPSEYERNTDGFHTVIALKNGGTADVLPRQRFAQYVIDLAEGESAYISNYEIDARPETFEIVFSRHSRIADTPDKRGHSLKVTNKNGLYVFNEADLKENPEVDPGNVGRYNDQVYVDGGIVLLDGTVARVLPIKYIQYTLNDLLTGTAWVEAQELLVDDQFKMYIYGEIGMWNTSAEAPKNSFSVTVIAPTDPDSTPDMLINEAELKNLNIKYDADYYDDPEQNTEYYVKIKLVDGTIVDTIPKVYTNPPRNPVGAN